MSIEAYVSGLTLSSKSAPVGRTVFKGGPTEESRKPPGFPADLNAAVDVGSILSFVSGVNPGEISDILFSVQLAQRAADVSADRFAETRAWYGKYVEVLEAVGWTTEQFAFATHVRNEGDFEMDKAALKVVAAVATGNQLRVLTASISALEKLAEGDGQSHYSTTMLQRKDQAISGSVLI